MIKSAPSNISLLGILAIAALSMQLMLLAPVSVGASTLMRSDCRDHTVVDFEEALNAMRPVAHPPSPGRLPFGPPGLRLSYGGPTVLPGSGEIGFSLSREDGKRRIQQSAWKVQSSLVEVKESGSPIQVLRKKQQSLDSLLRGSVERLRIGGFRVSKRVAFYRFEAIFKRGPITKERYSDYFRVVPRRVDLRLTLSSSSLRPGEVLIWRLENFGTVPFFYGLDYRIDRYENGQWLIDPISPEGFPSVGFFRNAGSSSQCQSIRLPEKMAPGRYRVSKKASSGSAKEQEFVSEFQIHP